MITKSGEMEARAVDQVVELMALAARTAPKAKGVDNLVVVAARAKVKDQLSAEMRRIVQEDNGLPNFERDAGNVDKAAVVLLLGQRVKPLGPRPCGFCGYKDCEENLKNSGLCAISIGDLGIALGSAVSVAAQHHVDNGSCLRWDGRRSTSTCSTIRKSGLPMGFLSRFQAKTRFSTDRFFTKKPDRSDSSGRFF